MAGNGGGGDSSGSEILKKKKKSLGGRILLILRALCCLTAGQRRALLEKADNAVVQGICECALNTLHGTVPVTKKQKTKLKKYKTVLRKLADTRKKFKKNWNLKKRLIIQKGEGLLPILLPPVLSLILSKLTT